MKNLKFLKSLSALALAGVMALSSVSLVKAEETATADEGKIKIEIDGEVTEKTLRTIKIKDVIHYSDSDFEQERTVSGCRGKSIYATEGSHYSFSPKEFSDETIVPVTGKLEGVVGDEDITLTFEYTSSKTAPGLASDSSGYAKTEYLVVNLYAEDINGEAIDGIGFKADNSISTGDMYFMYEDADYYVYEGWGNITEAFPDSKTKDGAVGFISKGYMYGALSLDIKYIIDDSGKPIDGKLEGNNCLKLKKSKSIDIFNFETGESGNDIENCTYTILDTENNKIADVTFFADDVWKTSDTLPLYEIKNVNENWDVELDIQIINDNDTKMIKTGNEKCNFDYYGGFSGRDGITVANITVKSKDVALETEKELTLTADKPSVSKDEMATLITENATKDVVIKTADGLTFTFAKGTMKAVDGKETYDFTASISKDYSKHSDMGVVTKDNFVQLIDFAYSGNLPAEASIKIPVGTDRAGQTLYYSQKTEAGYTLVQTVKVDDEGYVTVKQNHCSTYVLTTTDVSKDTTPDVNDETPSTGEETGSPDTGDTNNVFVYVIMVLVAGVALTALTVGNKMRKRA